MMGYINKQSPADSNSKQLIQQIFIENLLRASYDFLKHVHFVNVNIPLKNEDRTLIYILLLTKL
jgi:hypothetical protein